MSPTIAVDTEKTQDVSRRKKRENPVVSAMGDQVGWCELVGSMKEWLVWVHEPKGSTRQCKLSCLKNVS